MRRHAEGLAALLSGTKSVAVFPAGKAQRRSPVLMRAFAFCRTLDFYAVAIVRVGGRGVPGTSGCSIERGASRL